MIGRFRVLAGEAGARLTPAGERLCHLQSYLVAVGGAGYFRSAIVHPCLQTGQLRQVANAPEFSY